MPRSPSLNINPSPEPGAAQNLGAFPHAELALIFTPNRRFGAKREQSAVARPLLDVFDPFPPNPLFSQLGRWVAAERSERSGGDD